MKTFLKTLLVLTLVTAFLLTGCETPDVSSEDSSNTNEVSSKTSTDVSEPTSSLVGEGLSENTARLSMSNYHLELEQYVEKSCTLTLPKGWTAKDNMLYIDNNKVGQFSVSFDEISEKSLSYEKITIGNTDFYFTSYEDGIVDNIGEKDQRLALYVIYDYYFVKEDYWGSFTFLQCQDPVTFSQTEAECILSTVVFE